MGYHPVSIGIIGMGHVGPHAANSLILQGIADEILVCDENEDKLRAEVQDLNDSTVFAPHRAVITNCHTDYEKLAQCDVIINASGQVTLSAISRTGELFKSVDDARLFAGRIAAAGFTGYYVNVTNPCDVVAREIFRLSGLPSSHVMGTGTCLDSARLRTVIALKTQLAPESIQAYMVGEHGNSQIAAWSSVSIAGKLLNELSDNPRFAMDGAEAESLARKGGYIAYHGKQCTEYAIANAATRIVRAIVHDEKVVLAASVQLNGAYGQKGLFASVPCIIGKDGVEEVLEIDMNDAEKQGFADSCDVIRGNFEKLAPFSVESSRTMPIVLPKHAEDDRRLD
ncbi:lactate/malate family dehydrogenase [Bifidobacterium aquikefiri]|uniref:lactate/malate family dehydrogenase n=1 Tax=Bifidobacterium aquikefiri TaxID=1653207 RepID=UPI0039ECDFB5